MSKKVKSRRSVRKSAQKSAQKSARKIPTRRRESAAKDRRLDVFINKLKKIIDPHTGVNIIDMGLVKDVKVHKDSVALVFVPTSPFCPLVHYFVEAMDDAARKSGFKDCKITVKGCD